MIVDQNDFKMESASVYEIQCARRCLLGNVDLHQKFVKINTFLSFIPVVIYYVKWKIASIRIGPKNTHFAGIIILLRLT